MFRSIKWINMSSFLCHWRNKLNFHWLSAYTYTYSVGGLSASLSYWLIGSRKLLNWVFPWKKYLTWNPRTFTKKFMKWDDSKLQKHHQSKYVINWQFIDFIPRASLKKREGGLDFKLHFECCVRSVWDTSVRLWLINSIKQVLVHE